MDRTKVMELADKVGGLFRLTVLLQKRVQELVTGSPKLVDTKETNPIRIAMLEVEADAIELVNLTEEELAQLEAQTQMATDEAELLEALEAELPSGDEVLLDLPISINTGIPGPPMPAEPQRPLYLDEVCLFYPELKIVMAHGADPWWGEAIRLLLKYPNLYMMTSAWAPKWG